MQVNGKTIDIRLRSPGWIKSLEEEMSVERICGSIPMSTSSTLLAENSDIGEEYEMEGMGLFGLHGSKMQHELMQTRDSVEFNFYCCVDR